MTAHQKEKLDWSGKGWSLKASWWLHNGLTVNARKLGPAMFTRIVKWGQLQARDEGPGGLI